MPVGAVIEFSNITKTFGSVTAVDNLSFTVEPGRVTGFLGPNGAGKTTTLRMLLGLVAPTSGTATIGGIRYRDLPRPLHTVGAALEAASFHPGRTARSHLAVYAIAAGLPSARIDAVLNTVGLGAHGAQRVGGYSLGMRQRLGLAFTLLGDPGVLVLDAPWDGAWVLVVLIATPLGRWLRAQGHMHSSRDLGFPVPGLSPWPSIAAAALAATTGMAVAVLLWADALDGTLATTITGIVIIAVIVAGGMATDTHQRRHITRLLDGDDT